ncbi:response regulator transcription factor [Lysinibacillus sp. NPDC093216]|uniref:response regulator transcription factor n=1 Tax=Lysinibacillus sp. NPDC093216 TaxID=3390576 RepID=UPI003CFC7D2E
MIINVLLVDDRQLLLECLSYRLNNEPTIRVVGAISNPEFLLHEINTNSPDIVLMNIRMKFSSGLDLTIELLKNMPHLRVVILSKYDYVEYVQATYNAGASAFITEEKSTQELVFTIKQVYLGYKLFPKIEENKIDKMLTPKEYEILTRIAEDKTNSEISEEMMISIRTVEYHISSIIRKLNVESRVGAVVTAIKRGLLSIK